MDDLMWISLFIGIFSVTLLVLILRMKKTDPVFGCDKYKREGCNKVCGSECNFPNCPTSEKYRTWLVSHHKERRLRPRNLLIINNQGATASLLPVCARLLHQ